MSNYVFKSATELANLIRIGQVGSVEVVTEHIEQINRHNPTLNAVIISRHEEALKEAAQCDKEAAAGIFRGPLHGVPMTIKEQFWIKGLKSTLNFKMLKDWVAPEDAIVVSRLKNAGAIVLGKTNVPKNLTDYQIAGDIYPEGKNPYNTDYSPGGSSGGASAALSSGMVPIELGGDFGGSIRIPSNYCGLYGLKPTENSIPGHGSVPRPKGSRGGVFHMAMAGPMARTVEDVALVWNILKGPHPKESGIPRIQWKDPKDKKLHEYRIKWVDGWEGYKTSSTIRSTIADFTAKLASKGASVENSGPANDLHQRSLSVWVSLFGILITQDMPWFIKPLFKLQMKQNLLKGSSAFKSEFKRGLRRSFINYSETMGKRAEMVNEWENFFTTCDILICPMSFGPAFKRCKIGSPLEYDGQKLPYLDYAWPYVSCFNASGHPAMNIPLGIGTNGLPLGIQVVGPYWSEPDLLHFAKLVSAFTDGFVKPEGY